ncbi:MAG: acyl-phosphate glycerol 3-phosphate acyltransferase [Candidatus Rokubacteria bacterium 13_1_40CM_2_68_8]|nr:MAG: acyl-phosphate glycerol 3-phosphate acyltransferase [Candidatus Rokubacteria bacterium 13_1_40CM_2_68_8]
MSAVAIVTAYVIGAVPIGYLVGRAFGVADIRRHGSGTIGATNVLRTVGRLPALLTLGGDIAKGYAAVALGGALASGPWGDPGAAAACAVAAVIGNCWSVFLGFRGGKGVATGLGALLRLVPWAVLPAAALWLGVTASFRYVSLASILAAVCAAVAALLLGYPGRSVLAALGVGAIVVARHHANITRLLGGHEPKLGQRHTSA